MNNSIFSKNNNLISKIRTVVLYPANRSRYKSLARYIKETGLACDKKELLLLPGLVNKSLRRQVRYLSFLIFHIMKISNEWGAAGEGQVKAAFCRNRLVVSTAETITQGDMDKFGRLTKKVLKEFEIDGLELRAAKHKLENFQFDILGVKLKADDVNQIESVIRFLGSNLIFYGGQYEEVWEYVVGEGSSRHYGGYDLYDIERELIRTPNMIMAKAALIGDRKIYLRQESFETVFNQKWVRVFEDEFSYLVELDINRNVSLGIKRKALSLYKAESKDLLEKIQEDFIKDMKETIVFHELGHGAINHELMSLEDSAIAEATEVFGGNIYSMMMEVLADFSPKWQKLKGPMKNMVDVAKKDKKRAERLFYVYLSDVFFYDTGDEYMYLYSDIILLLILRYIKKDLHIDFKKLEHDIDFAAKHKDDGKVNMVDMLIKRTANGMQSLKKMVENTEYELQSGTKDFRYMKAVANTIFDNIGFKKDLTSFHYQSKLWLSLLKYVTVFSKDEPKFKAFLDSEEKKIMANLFANLAGQKKVVEYGYDHRKYILERFKELGLIGY
jgi:hypothetical protein